MSGDSANLIFPEWSFFFFFCNYPDFLSILLLLYLAIIFTVNVRSKNNIVRSCVIL